MEENKTFPNPSKETSQPKETDGTPKFQTFTCKKCQKEMTFPYDPSEEFIEQPTCASCVAKMNKSFEDNERPWFDSNFNASDSYGYIDYEKPRGRR